MMYHNVASSIRSKLTLRGSSSSLATSLVALPLSYTTPSATRMAFALHPLYYAPTHQAMLSMSMFATVGSATGDGTSSSSDEQRRPFWATRPTTDETTKAPTTSINTVDHSVNAAAAGAGISMEDIKTAVTKAKKQGSSDTVKAPKKAAAKKTKAKKEEDEDDEEVDDDEEEVMMEEDDEADVKLPPDQDSINTMYMAKVIAAKHNVTHTLAKRIVDEVVDMMIDGIIEKKEVRISRLGIFSKAVQSPKTMTKIQTKEKYTVPAKYRVSFKISSTLRKKVGELELPPSAK